MNRSGYSLVELLSTVTLLVVVSTAGFMLFTSGGALWSTVDTQISLQESSRNLFQRLGFELHESGRDSSDNLQVWISNNAGPNNTDIIRFAIPICLCGMNVMDENSEVRYWGAPLKWGSTGCTNTYTVDNQGKVTICHIPPGNSNNEHTINVSPAAVKAHLAHGDRLGDCNACDNTSYSNRFIEYRMNSNNQVIRRVLASDLSEIRADLIAANVNDLQAVLAGDNRSVTITADFRRNTISGRQISVSRSEQFILRNYD